MFKEYPYINLTDLNLDWLMRLVKEVNEKLSEYLESSVITFADPITWDITQQYTALTCVVNSDGTAYLSKQPVPTGVDILNTNYWLPIFNYDDNINTLRDQIAYNAKDSATCTKDLYTGDLVFWKGLIYSVIYDMPAGSAFLVDANIRKYTVDEKINDVRNEITRVSGDVQAEALAREQADITLQGNIDNEALAREQADITLQGNIDNEALTRAQADTTLQGNIDVLALSEPLNVLTIGVKGDGVTPCSDIINQYSANYDLYFPDGVYLIDQPLTLHKSIIGAVAPRMAGRGSVLKCGFAEADYVVKYLEGVDGVGVEIRNIAIDCDSISGGIAYAPAATSYRPPVKISNVSVWNTALIGINISPASRVSRIAWLNECSVTGGTNRATTGYFFNANAVDSHMYMCTSMYTQKGVVNNAGGLSVIGGHFYTGRGPDVDDTYWNGTITIESTADIYATNLYVDTALQYWVQRSGTAIIGNLFLYNDGYYITYGVTNQSVTVLRADQSGGARIKVSNLSYGGTFTGVTLFGQEVYIDNITLESQSPTFTAAALPPMVNGLPMKYRMWIGSGNYHVVAAIYHQYADGRVKLRIGRNNYQANVNFSKNGSTITLSKEAVSGFDSTPLWYKTSGNVTYIYTNNMTFWATVEVLCSSITDVNMRACTSALNLGSLTEWSGITQADTTGLTVIS